MDIQLGRSSLRGTVQAIASKSDLHRLLIGAALSDSPTFVDFTGMSNDITATLQCISAIGCTVTPTESGVLVEPAQAGARKVHLSCQDCGSTLRFMLPVAAALFESFTASGEGRLLDRPIGELARGMQEHGCTLSSHSLPLEVSGKMHSGIFEIAGNVSSQYITGLLLSLPLLEGDSQIVLTSALSSAAYVDMTLKTLAIYGIEVRETNSGWHIKGSQQYRSPGRVVAEGDWSSAAVWLCAGAIAGPVTVTGLSRDSLQADMAVVQLLEKLGAAIEYSADGITVSRGELRPMSIDVDQFPDLMPVLSATLAMCPGASLIYNASRLRLKESDRLSAMAELLSKLGVGVEARADSFSLTGGGATQGSVSAMNDHRIVMAATLMSAATDIRITGIEAIEKSYPSFFRDYAALGGKIVKE